MVVTVRGGSLLLLASFHDNMDICMEGMYRAGYVKRVVLVSLLGDFQSRQSFVVAGYCSLPKTSHPSPSRREVQCTLPHPI